MFDLTRRIFRRNSTAGFAPLVSVSLPSSTVHFLQTFQTRKPRLILRVCVPLLCMQLRLREDASMRLSEILAPFVEVEELRLSLVPASTTKTPSRSDTSSVPVHCPRPTRSPTRADARVISPRRCRPLGQLVPTLHRPALPSPCIMRSLLENVYFVLFAASRGYFRAG